MSRDMLFFESDLTQAVDAVRVRAMRYATETHRFHEVQFLCRTIDRLAGDLARIKGLERNDLESR